MSKKQWMVLLMLFLTYLLLGASIFYHIESRLEIERVEEAKRERIEINALLHEHYVPSHRYDYEEILGKLTRYCGKSVYNYTEGETDPLKWDFYNSFYFAYTVVSTIGYGNLAPTNMLCRILMIFYGLIGIPMNGILLTQLGEFFSRVFVKAHEKYKSYKHSRDDYYPRKLTTFETHKVGLAAQIFVYLMPGFVMFIFFPAFLFSHYEGWTYDEAVYYAFVTLTTIGFGDYVAGQDNSKGNGIFFILYKAFLICWISFGLGYTVMIMTFIARGMRSKKITRIEHKLAVNLKHTQSKIWNELNKEMNYLRRVFNELQLSKVKRIYVDECNYEVPLSKFPRSSSFPDLRDLLYGAKQKDNGICHRPRRRANSEIVPTEDQITRVVSETDLQRIDKTATFATHAMVQPAELLARLVNILGYIPPATEDLTGGGKSSAEKESLADGKGKISDPHGIWTIGHDKIPRFLKPRSRAASEVRLRETRYEDRNTERTWSGPTAAKKMQELMKTQMYGEPSNKDRGVREAKFAKFRSLSLAKSVPKALIPSGPCKNWFSASFDKKPSDSERETNNKDVQAHSFVTGLNHMEDERRDSRSSVVSNSMRHYYTHTGAGNAIDTEHTNLLEETSVADFFRALTFLHASVATTNGSWTAAATIPATDRNDPIHRNQPRRKMGTASLTPPKLPSLFTLFSPPQPPVVQELTVNGNNANNPSSSLSQGCSDSRKNSFTFAMPTIGKSRRFSLRPVATPISPPTPPRANGSPFLSDSRRTSYQTKSTFSSESPKEPLIRTEQIPGLSSPIKSSTDGRRFSLRPTLNQAEISAGNPATATAPTTTKPLPRWKTGMLQRQIGQINLRRRARAFSLSDVQPDNSVDNSEPFTLSSSIYKKKKSNRGTVRKNVSLHEASNGNGESVPRTALIPDQFSSLVRHPEERNSSSSSLHETISTNNTRREDNNFPIIHPYGKTISNPISNETIDRSNKSATLRGNDVAESIFYKTERNNAEKQQFAADQPTSLENHERTFSSLIITDTELSQQSLLEVKVENPVATNTIRPSFFKRTDDIRPSPDNSHHLTNLTVEKSRSNTRSNKS